MAGQHRGLRIGIAAAAVAGAVAVPATALAAQGGMLPGALVDGVASVAHQVPGFENVAFPQQAGPGRGEPRLDALAKALNVSVDTLKQAVEATRTELKDTKPTTAAERQAFRDQYEATLAAKLHISVDALKQAEQSTRPQGGPPVGRGGAHGPHADADGYFPSLASALGVSTEALQTAWQQAHEATKPATPPTDAAGRQAAHDAFVAALAAKLNLPADKVRAALDASRPQPPTQAEQRVHLRALVQRLVANSRITQAQADQILADFDAGKPVMDVLKQYLPQPQGGEHGPRGPHGQPGQGQPGQGQPGAGVQPQSQRGVPGHGHGQNA